MKVLVLGAGGPAGVNTCKALSAHEVVALDENAGHLVWCKPYAQTVHAEITVENVNEINADIVIPQPDTVTRWLSDNDVKARSFLPDSVALCQDKFTAGLKWREAGLRTDPIELVDSPWDEYPYWLRARHGAGAKAAILARSYEEAEHWLGFWKARDPLLDFVAEGFLPGRDFAWSSIWYEGELITSFTRERLEYIYPHLTPEGLTGTPTIAQIVHDEKVNEMALAAVAAVDEKPHGIMSVDLREDIEGVPRPTEINAGRGFTTFGLWATQTEPNLFDAILGLAFGERPDLPQFNCLPEGLKLHRHIDCGSFFT